jgi:hypothetical protein
MAGVRALARGQAAAGAPRLPAAGSLPAVHPGPVLPLHIYMEGRLGRIRTDMPRGYMGARCPPAASSQQAPGRGPAGGATA